MIFILYRNILIILFIPSPSGFCGTRTMAFEEPIFVSDDAEGFYLLLRLTSDDEPERRVWKMTTRSEDSRGEQLYQASFPISKDDNDKSQEETSWQRVIIPFSEFVQVRGPIVVDGFERLNTTNGLYQIGLSLSKFQIGANVTELDNFRPGFFEIQLKEIGVFGRQRADANDKNRTKMVQNRTVQTLSKEEADRKRPVLVRALSPLFTLLFSEKKRRRDSARRLLKERGYTQYQIARYAFKRRIQQKGIAGAIIQTIGLTFQDCIRFVLGSMIRFTLFYPTVLLFRIINWLPTLFKKTRYRKPAD